MPTQALFTDLYQLTMMAGYFHRGVLDSRATFELFVRRLPPNRNCLLFAGLEQALEYIATLQFSADDIGWLRVQPQFERVSGQFFDYLRSFRFTGDVWAMREGTPFFPHEPVVRVTAPIAEAQVVETALLAILNFQTTVASKAHRIVHAAHPHPVLEFGARRAHGLDAALLAARAAYLAGGSATSFVEAGHRFGIPLSGTMAHSWVLAAPSEAEAFREFASLFDKQTVLLLDTFDVSAATQTLIASGMRPLGVRIDSGNLEREAARVRRALDRAGLTSTKIIASGDLDEWKIAALISAGAPIDTFAVGTALVTSDDAPALGGVYKLVELEEQGRIRGVMKHSEGKGTWPGRKQVWRIHSGGMAIRDIIALGDEPGPTDAIALLERVMRNGERVEPPPGLADLRRECGHMVAALPPQFRQLETSEPLSVEPSAAMQALIDRGRG